ncbi:MAG: hypothetical protein IRZ00_20295, partial [Gemmatimonadetes bacterium]|nr:hypothetical protein [Gemmatimonadota bacterium]
HHLAGEVVRAILATAPHATRPLAPHERAAFEARDALRGRPVRVDGVDAGIAIGLAPDGALLLDRDGTTETIRAGSVRAAPAGCDLSFTGTAP